MNAHGFYTFLLLTTLFAWAGPPVENKGEGLLYHMTFDRKGPTEKLFLVNGFRPSFGVLENGKIDYEKGVLQCDGLFPAYMPVSTEAVQAVHRSDQLTIVATFRVDTSRLTNDAHGFIYSWGGYNWGLRLSVSKANCSAGEYALYLSLPGFQSPTLLRHDGLVSGKWHQAKVVLDKPAYVVAWMIDEVEVKRLTGAEKVHCRDLTYCRFVIGASQTGLMLPVQTLPFTGEIKDIKVFAKAVY